MRFRIWGRSIRLGAIGITGMSETDPVSDSTEIVSENCSGFLTWKDSKETALKSRSLEQQAEACSKLGLGSQPCAARAQVERLRSDLRLHSAIVLASTPVPCPECESFVEPVSPSVERKCVRCGYVLPSDIRRKRIQRRIIFGYNLVVLAFLLWLYYHCKGTIERPPVGLPGRSDLPATLPFPWGAIWWGALGGVTVSLTGVFKYDGIKWESRWYLWHWARPLIGIVAGAIAYLFIVILSAAASGKGPGQSLPTPWFADLVAFLVGYRETRFLGLLQQAGDTLVNWRDGPRGD